MRAEWFVPPWIGWCRTALCHKGFGRFSVPYGTDLFRPVYRIGAEITAEFS